MSIQVAVLFGGKSVEHEISVISALQAMNSIPSKYEIIPVYITKTGEFFTGAGLRDINRYRDIPALLKTCTKVVFTPVNGRTALVRTPGKRFGNNIIATPDVAFPIVHGTNVEDGNLQGFLGTLGLPYVGCDVLSSAVGMDKYVMKSVLAAEGIPVLPALRFRSSVPMEEIKAQAEAKIGYPLIVKPVNLGSSVGISKVGDETELETALDLAFTFADVVLLERAVVQLKEINCSVLGDEEGAQPSVLEEPVAQDKILSYKDKYMDGGKGGKNGGKSSGMASLKRKIPAEIDDATAEQVKDLAVKAFLAMGCSGLVRIDFMLDMGENKVYLNEINTIPGSLAFYLWEPAGVKYPALLEKLISLALKRARKQQELTYSFDTNVFAMGGGFGGAKGSKGAKG